MSEPAEDPDKLDPFNRAFVTAVLRMNGIRGTANLEQFKAAIMTMSDYYTAMAASADAGAALEDDSWLEGLDIADAGQLAAFCFVRFGTITPPDAGQRAAFDRWRGVGAPSQYLH